MRIVVRVSLLHLSVIPIQGVLIGPAFGSSSDLEVRSVLLQFAVVHGHGVKLKRGKKSSQSRLIFPEQL